MRDAPWYWTVAFAVVFSLCVFRYGTPAGIDADQSWAAVLGWAHLHGARFGVELVFSYGPLGYLHPSGPYNPRLFETYLFGQVLLTLGYTFIYAMTFRRLAGLESVLFALVVLLPCRLQNDVLLVGTGIFALVALDRFVRRSRDDRWAWAGLAVIALQMNALGLMKFTLFPLTLLLAGIGALLFLRDRRPRAAAAWLAGWLASLLVLWLGHGQQLGDLGAFLRGALRIVAGYGAGMGVETTPGLLALGLFALVATAATLLYWLRRGSPRDLRALLLFGYLAFCLVLAWRNAFTRADIWHVRFFFPLASFVVFALLALAGGRLAPRWRQALGAVALLCIAGVLSMALPQMKAADYAAAGRALRQHVGTVLRGELGEQRAQQREALRRQYDLPAFRRLVGSERVDLFGCNQAVLLLNDFNYAPRPVFQSYAAYTARLQQTNEAFYLGANAPRFVMLGLCPIDQHYPASEDALALLALLRHYRPVAAEKRFVLMQRADVVPIAPLPASAAAMPVEPGQWIDVPAGHAAMRIHLDYGLSLSGRLHALFLREPSLSLEVQTADRQVRAFRLVRPVARSGFLLSPLLLEDEDYLRWYYGLELAVRRVRVKAAVDWQQSLFAPGITIGFSPLDLPRGVATAVPAGLVSAIAPGIIQPPLQRADNIRLIMENDRPASSCTRRRHAVSTPGYCDSEK
ncbi:hypothetical protein [Tahibacter sp.]|uniref:hypothetical protein n=1 Tax=Tahibacter sp. TaxID=2056211 RepID=UPI0028C4917D|nr:hypothetical protein [Tahibacter sp.]